MQERLLRKKQWVSNLQELADHKRCDGLKTTTKRNIGKDIFLMLIKLLLRYFCFVERIRNFKMLVYKNIKHHP